MEKISYREPTADDIGKIVEVTDFGREHEDRHWIRQRLVKIDYLLATTSNIIHASGFPFLACSTIGTIEENMAEGEDNLWMYARIEEHS